MLERAYICRTKVRRPDCEGTFRQTVVPDDSPYSIGGIGLLGTEPASDAMSEKS